MTGIAVRATAAGDTHGLRHRVLRPNQSREDCAYPLDAAADTLHVGAFDGGALVGVGSIFREPPAGHRDAGAWRIRGMAVEPAARGRGVGARILRALLRHAASAQDGGFVWCNGRIAVEPFYLRQGFHRVGDVFDLPPLGPHVLMRRALAARDRA